MLSLERPARRAVPIGNAAGGKTGKIQSPP